VVLIWHGEIRTFSAFGWLFHSRVKRGRRSGGGPGDFDRRLRTGELGSSGFVTGGGVGVYGWNRGDFNLSRAVGKSTVCRGKACSGYARPGVWCGGQSFGAGRAEIPRKVEQMAALRHSGARDGTIRFSLAFPNGSRIVGLPGRKDRARVFGGVVIADRRKRRGFLTRSIKHCGRCWPWAGRFVDDEYSLRASRASSTTRGCMAADVWKR